MKGDITGNKALSSRTLGLHSGGKPTQQLQHKANTTPWKRTARSQGTKCIQHTPSVGAGDGGTLTVTESWQMESTRHGQVHRGWGSRKKYEKCLRRKCKIVNHLFGHSVDRWKKWDNKLKNWDLMTGTLEYYTKVEFGLFSADNRAYKGSSPGNSMTWVNCMKILQCLWGRQKAGEGWREGDWVGDYCDHPGNERKARSEAGNSREEPHTGRDTERVWQTAELGAGGRETKMK